ncbi:WAP four-disulfide core domain protein 5-like [Cervus elaphus]|uniref:WAP four-disulfide core domain protein 5-like n=1 Tax=Cervus elaphus TaxID=9860 RepID=UPI001CC29EC0|nr:WAP four-disulfide core domain protein 5-like [Cervus elaphus]
MRAQSILLLVAPLGLGSQLPAALGRRKGEKSGGCPPDDGPCLLSVPDQCLHDSQCPSGMKCCRQACFLQCVRKVSVKMGRCPEDRLRCLSPAQHLCSKDSDCQGCKRCCLGACGRDCRNPV